jgi:hypothetical protein
MKKLPAAWLARLQHPGSRKSGILEASATAPTKIIKPGSRNIELTRLAGKLRNTGLSDDALFQALLAETIAFVPRPSMLQKSKLSQQASHDTQSPLILKRTELRRS